MTTPAAKGRARRLTGSARSLLEVRSHQMLLLAALTGALTGLGVALFETVVVEVMFDHLVQLPLWVLALLPTIGLGLTALSLRLLGPATPETSDAYLRAFHDPAAHLTLRALPARMLGAVATLGFGGAMGLEGPSLYLGASTGAALQARLHRVFRGVDHRVLMVAGAAAGVAAIFKAPATGAVFALEVPYQDDFARRMLLPALVASATGYLTFVVVHGPTALFAARGTPPFSVVDLLGGIALGVLAGVGARSFAALLRAAKRLANGPRLLLRILVTGAVLAALVGISQAAAHEPLTLGTGYRTINWALAPDRAVWLLLAVLVLRCLATATTVAGGGVGGLFIPLVVAGALLGRAVSGLLPDLHPDLAVILGVAAFLGAGYRVPLAAVVFVAETTGRPGFVVPALLAAVSAELVMGRSSITAYQRPGLLGGHPGKAPETPA